MNRCRGTWVAGIDYQKHSLAVSEYSLTSFLVWAQVNEQWAHTLIDTGVIRDFMSSMFTKKVKILLQQKRSRDTYEVTFIDDKALSYNKRVVDHETEDTWLQIRPHVWDMWFDITLISKHDVVLELLWLQNVNSKISFWNQTIDFLIGKLVHMSKEMLGSDLQICTILTDKLKQKLQKNPEQVKILWSKQINLATTKLMNSTLSKKYKDFVKLFVDKAPEKTLSAHQPWDNKILIVEDKMSEKTLIYSLSSEKLEVLHTYLNENLKKRFIWESQSLTGYLILFILKKDKTLQLCVNYWGLNNIMIKISYLLPLILKLQDWLQGAKIFSKFDISGAYNWIQIKSHASATFQTYINNVLRKHLDVFVVVYLNDILVYSRNEADHKVHIRKVLETLKKADLQIKSEKSQFHWTEIEFLSYIITDKNIKMNLEKVRVIVK